MMEFDAKVDYYRVLGVAARASADDIKAAYRRLVLECHPDKQPGAGDRVRHINEAWEVLRDAGKRQRYHEAAPDSTTTTTTRRSPTPSTCSSTLRAGPSTR